MQQLVRKYIFHPRNKAKIVPKMVFQQNIRTDKTKQGFGQGNCTKLEGGKNLKSL